MNGEGGERIAKRIARAGVCSRREAERRIFEGRVRLNGQALADPAVNVGPRDLVEVDGAALPEPEPARLWRYHKPVGLVTTDRDPEGRPTVFESLPAHLPRVVSVGRLDLASEGLLLLTNDGGLARELELPARGWVRRYRARVRGRVDEVRLARVAGGVEIDGERYGPITASLNEQRGGNAWLTVSLAEGRKPRGPPGAGISRPPGEPPDPHRLRPLPARQPPAGRRRRNQAQGHKGAARAGGVTVAIDHSFTRIQIHAVCANSMTICAL